MVPLRFFDSITKTPPGPTRIWFYLASGIPVSLQRDPFIGKTLGEKSGESFFPLVALLPYAVLHAGPLLDKHPTPFHELPVAIPYYA